MHGLDSVVEIVEAEDDVEAGQDFVLKFLGDFDLEVQHVVGLENFVDEIGKVFQRRTPMDVVATETELKVGIVDLAKSAGNVKSENSNIWEQGLFLS